MFHYTPEQRSTQPCHGLCPKEIHGSITFPCTFLHQLLYSVLYVPDVLVNMAISTSTFVNIALDFAAKWTCITPPSKNMNSIKNRYQCTNCKVNTANACSTKPFLCPAGYEAESIITVSCSALYLRRLLSKFSCALGCNVDANSLVLEPHVQHLHDHSAVYYECSPAGSDVLCMV